VIIVDNPLHRDQVLCRHQGPWMIVEGVMRCEECRAKVGVEDLP
jgi:hypothetical protein